MKYVLVVRKMIWLVILDFKMFVWIQEIMLNLFRRMKLSVQEGGRVELGSDCWGYRGQVRAGVYLLYFIIFLKEGLLQIYFGREKVEDNIDFWKLSFLVDYIFIKEE